MRAACYASLALFMSLAQSAMADPIHFSTSGQFDLSSGTVALSGISNATADLSVPLGSIPLIGGQAQGSTPFHIRFEFDGGLPSIEVAGSIGWIGYSSNEFIENPVVTTSATSAQIDLYPTIFQEMLAHPDWIRTTSYAGYLPSTSISMTVQPYDPFEVKSIPEPSMALVFTTGLAALTGWARRRRVKD
ncbi:hypothetical protein V5E97_05975 [Singulisphaera sp. Ch08]|uniref:PEP-CTERM sorting domain-containing protein n=1 Tax=Singulisphaera sp. Ch08 TaxID=3120278 RepID=A0AAU7CLN7_9BACT